MTDNARRFTGAMTALITPMHGDAVDRDSLAALVEDQIAAGIHGLVAVGTTGESATLTVREHLEVIAHVVACARGRVPVIAGAGANATAEAIALSKASEDAGADGLLHVTPYYNKPTQDGLYRHFAKVASSTKLPIILYNVPARTACDMHAGTVTRLAEIDNIVAIKEATADMRRASEILAACGERIAVLSGDDFTAFPLYSLGGSGVISVVSNVLPGAMAGMWNAVAAGDWQRARALHFAILPLTSLLFVEANPIPVKEALAILGRVKPDIRPPLYRCSDELRQRLTAQLKAEGLL